MSDEVYYKLYLTPKGLLTVVCMQYFDEFDYNPLKFYKDIWGNPWQFDTEEKAAAYLNNHFYPEAIDPDYITPNNPKFVKT